jgi:hypothetical protein
MLLSVSDCPKDRAVIRIDKKVINTFDISE